MSSMIHAERGRFYVKAVEVGDNVCPDLGILDPVGAAIGVPSHRTGTGTLVVTLAGLLGGEREALQAALQRLSGLHGGWLRRSCAVLCRWIEVSQRK